MFYVKESDGRYYLADPRWSRAYEEGMLRKNQPPAFRQRPTPGSS